MRLIKRLFLFIIIAAITVGGLIIGAGYGKYKQAVTQLSVKDAALKIREKENYTSISQIPDTFIKAMVAVEDKRFYKHHGFDIIGIIRAFKVNFETKSAREGGSSITQQLAKNMYFINDNTLTRKIAELMVASEIEKYHTKDEILELYFNVIYYGSGYYNIYDASMGYFNKEPAKLTDYEATLLAGIPNAPSVYSLNNNSVLAAERQETVVKAMIDCGYLAEDEAEDILNYEEDN